MKTTTALTPTQLLALADKAERIAAEIDANPADELQGFQNILRARAAGLRAKANR